MIRWRATPSRCTSTPCARSSAPISSAMSGASAGCSPGPRRDDLDSAPAPGLALGRPARRRRRGRGGHLLARPRRGQRAVRLSVAGDGRLADRCAVCGGADGPRQRRGRRRAGRADLGSQRRAALPVAAAARAAAACPAGLYQPAHRSRRLAGIQRAGRRPGGAGRAADAGAARTRRQHGAAHDRAAARGHAGAGTFDLVHHCPRTATAGARRGGGFAPLVDSAGAARRARPAARGAAAGAGVKRPAAAPGADARRAAHVHCRRGARITHAADRGAPAGAARRARHDRCRAAQGARRSQVRPRARDPALRAAADPCSR